MKQTINGMEFEYEHGSSMAFSVIVDPSAGHRPVPYQLRMLQENRIPRLLPMTSEEVNGARILRYDYSSKRRFVQLLHTEPPDFRQFVEAAYLLVKTLADCTEYMLSESQFVLHEEFIFAGQRLTDFLLCYLPVDGLRKKPMTEELRCLLLRMLSTVNGPIESGITPIFGILSQEPYSIQHLKNQLKLIWLQDHKSESSQRKGDREGKKQDVRILDRIHKLLIGNKKNKDERPVIRREPAAIAVKTEKLARNAEQVDKSKSIVLAISRNGNEEKQIMREDRFIVGRNKTGVHYTDLTEGVSRIHCEILRGESGLTVKDLGSLNGTSVNGEPLVPYKSYPFKPGDVLKFVQTEIRMADERRFSPLAESESTVNR